MVVNHQHLAALRIDTLVLIGAPATRPEPEYGWIEPGRPAAWPASDGRIFEVGQFWEKPGPALASRLYRRRCFWSTFTTLATVQAFRRAFMLAGTPVDDLFSDLLAAGPAGQDEVLETAYAAHSPVCFSSGVMSRIPSHCLVLPLVGSAWTDIGSPARLAQVTAAAASA